MIQEPLDGKKPGHIYDKLMNVTHSVNEDLLIVRACFEYTWELYECKYKH